jgi:hypothetical protein
MSAIRFVEQALQSAWINAPGLLGDVAGRATLAVCSLRPEEFAREINGAYGGESRCFPAGVRHRLVAGNTALVLCAGRCARLGAQIVGERPSQTE